MLDACTPSGVGHESRLRRLAARECHTCVTSTLPGLHGQAPLHPQVVRLSQAYVSAAPAPCDRFRGLALAGRLNRTRARPTAIAIKPPKIASSAGWKQRWPAQSRL